MDWREFFEKADFSGLDQECFRCVRVEALENLYKAFKARMLEEMNPPIVCETRLSDEDLEKLRNAKPGEVVWVEYNSK